MSELVKGAEAVTAFNDLVRATAPNGYGDRPLNDQRFNAGTLAKIAHPLDEARMREITPGLRRLGMVHTRSRLESGRSIATAIFGGDARLGAQLRVNLLPTGMTSDRRLTIVAEARDVSVSLYAGVVSYRDDGSGRANRTPDQIESIVPPLGEAAVVLTEVNRVLQSVKPFNAVDAAI